MDSDKTYWFEQPYLPGSYNIAVQPFLGADGRLHFSVPMGKYWALTGKLIKDERDYFEFQCDDNEMRARGGTYKFTSLTLEKVRNSRWIPAKDDILQTCQTDEELHQWYRIHWPNERIRKYKTSFTSNHGEKIMQLKDINSADELGTYLENRQLHGIKSEDDSVENLLKLCKQYNIPTSMLRMHTYLQKK